MEDRVISAQEGEPKESILVNGYNGEIGNKSADFPARTAALFWCLPNQPARWLGVP